MMPVEDSLDSLLVDPNAELDGLLVEQMPDAVIYADTQGLIVRWNRAAQNLFGYDAGEALGQSLDLIIPPHLRAAHWEGFHKAIVTRATKYAGHAVKTGAVHKNGTRVYADVSFALIQDADGSVIGAVAIARERVKGP
jgi:PAS domain S-box-containing protein